MGDGDGWVRCELGHRHWGRFGAAGLLIKDGDSFVLQHRAPWTHEGDTWGIPGGARDSHEDAVQAATREAAEEAALDPASVRATGLLVDDHGGWSYTTVVARPQHPINPHAANAESTQIRWWQEAEIAALPLHRGFAGTWRRLRRVKPPLALIVDSRAMLPGSGTTPDEAVPREEWWNRLFDLARFGVVDDSRVDAHSGPPLDILLPRVTVLGAEGPAAGVTDEWWRDAVSGQPVVDPAEIATEVERACLAALENDERVLVVSDSPLPAVSHAVTRLTAADLLALARNRASKPG
ncbi:ADP-ribose pyrophosphatase YjhB, NUDIX family [Frankineae bacterium MT45]|nr:ADP-ribose pyrophosphatase YjhB, NUDIX family [Frankineae bacterium MT45]